MADLDLIPKYDYSVFVDTVNSLDTQQDTLTFIEETLQNQHNSLGNMKAGTQGKVDNSYLSSSLLEQKKAQYLQTETEFRKALGNVYKHELMAKAVKFTLQEQARATGESDNFLDPFFSDIDISKLSNLQNYNNVIESKRLEYIRDGYDDPEEIDSKIHSYVSERVSPMVADVLFEKEDSTDPQQKQVIMSWLNAESTISTAIPELRDVLVGGERPTEIQGLEGESVLHIFPKISKEERTGHIKVGLVIGEIGFGLITSPFLSGSTALSGIVGAIDISLGVPAVLRGKDPLQELVLGTERADNLEWWQKALYAVPGLAGLKPTVTTTAKLPKAVYSILSKKHGIKQAEQIISEGRASTELALSRIVGSPEWNELKELADTGKWKEKQLGLADQLELSDIIWEIEEGTNRLPDEILLAHSRANNPLQGIAQKASLGDRKAIDNIYNLVKRANESPNDQVKVTGDINPFMILNDFRSMESKNVAKDIVEEMNEVKPSVRPRPSKATEVFGE